MYGKVQKILVLCGLVAAQQSVIADVPERLADTPMALAFGAPPTIGDPILSPAGTHMVFVQQNQLGAAMLRSMNLEDGEIATLFEGTQEGYDINQCLFANETRVLCDMQFRGAEFESAADQGYMAVDIDGTGRLHMVERSGCQSYDEQRGQLRLDRLPDDSEHVLFVCGGTASRLNIYTGEVTPASGAGEVGRDIAGGQQLYTNGHGFGNLYRGRDGNVDRWFVRRGPDAEWSPLLQTSLQEYESPFRPVGYGAGVDRVFNIAWDDDTQAWSLYRQDLSGGANQLVFAHGATDVELVDTMGPHDRVVAAVFVDGRSQRAIIDRHVADVYQYLAELLPELEIEILDESWDQNLYLARVRGTNGTGELLLVDMENEAVQQLGPEYDHLTGFALAETTLFRFDSSTGGPITAQLTRPYDIEGPVPAVVLARSHASHRDATDPDYLVQFLAASGYVVLQVNNRVDAEFGTGWLPSRAAVGWNRSADDMKDAAEFLIASGFTEADTVCGGGKDYGAYVALMSAIKYPEIFGCVVSIAGVADPAMSAAAPAGSVTDVDWLDDASPIRRAGELDAPTLLFHGGNDAVLSIDAHAVALEDALSAVRKDVVLIEYPFAGHEIRRGSYRVDMLARTRGFLAENIGPPLMDDEKMEQEYSWRPPR